MSACPEPGCGGTIAPDGYCDTCGARGQPAAAPSALGGSIAASARSVAAPSAPVVAGGDGSTTRHKMSPRAASQRTGSSRTGLGAGLLTVDSTDTGDPALAIMSSDDIATALGAVAEERRYCTGCGEAVGRGSDGRPGRITGFCSSCRTPFDFQTHAPALRAGELVAGQYEVLGPLAHGGMGWIYLGRDKAVSDRWVVLKGLLDDDDPDAAAAAVAERQFLAQIEHANIVGIYNFVTHGGRGYIVMEYVGGESLNAKLKRRREANAGTPDPLPVGDAIAYVIGVLPAFSYLHDLGLVYNDLKPANIMAVGDDVKLIDVGAVMRVDDQHAAIFGTAGFQAPEVPTHGPSIASDLHTVGRTLAVLVLDFVFHVGDYEHAIPPPEAGGVLERWESLHRLLLKATATHPDDRFRTAADLGEQLAGVLREIVAVTTATPRPAASRLFGGDRLASLLVDRPGFDVTAATAAALPVPKIDPADPAAAFLQDIADTGADLTLTLIENARRDDVVVDSLELRLAEARALVDTGLDARPVLDRIGAEDPWEWRVWWYRALQHLAAGEAHAAADAFGRVWTELPGELAPRAGAALAAEAAREHERAAELYERVIAVDPTHVSATFGLARCRLALGDPAGAVAALQLVGAGSATYEAAQVAVARALIRQPRPPGTAELTDAARAVERLQLDAIERSRLAAEILERALAASRDGTLDQAQGLTLFGHALDDRGIRRGLEATYRELARLSPDPARKIALVDRANAVRPRTLL